MAQLLSRKAPSLFWTMVEGRSVVELSWFYSLRLAMKRLPKGDGHPVITFPGFFASDASTRPMRSLLDDLGYTTFGWGLGRNLIFDDHREESMRELLREVYRHQERKVSLIGWSLGGVFAREIAKNHPDLVRSVITLGSPISGDMEHSNARRLFHLINGEPELEMMERLRTLRDAPPVPCTSIYTKTDGVVAWRGSLQDESEIAENIQVPASHVGLGVNPLVMYAMADRLAQAEGEWKPFAPKGIVQKNLFKKPKI
ncbi:MAG: alpha/beta hydrolase [Acidimicrobiales bacterium]|nr:MAG: alpha/beta hydrolase [Acidimicrobiales bacterium]